MRVSVCHEICSSLSDRGTLKDFLSKEGVRLDSYFRRSLRRSFCYWSYFRRSSSSYCLRACFKYIVILIVNPENHTTKKYYFIHILQINVEGTFIC